MRKREAPLPHNGDLPARLLDSEAVAPLGRDGARVSALRSGRVLLRPITASDYEFVFHLETHVENIDRWRFRGATPGPEHFVRTLFDGVLTAFLVQLLDGGRPIGTVTLYGADLGNGHAYLAAASLPGDRSTGLMIEALGLLIEYAFTTWPFRRLYIDTLEFNYQQFRSATRWLLEEEGRLKDHTFHRGRYWDRVILTLTRERWGEYRKYVMSGPPAWDLPDPPPGKLPFDAFAALLVDELGLVPDAVGPDARFVEDLGLDSMGAFALGVLLEWLVGENLPAGLASHIVTLGDAYAWYQARVAD